LELHILKIGVVAMTKDGRVSPVFILCREQGGKEGANCGRHIPMPIIEVRRPLPQKEKNYS